MCTCARACECARALCACVPARACVRSRALARACACVRTVARAQSPHRPKIKTQNVLKHFKNVLCAVTAPPHELNTKCIKTLESASFAVTASSHHPAYRSSSRARCSASCAPIGRPRSRYTPCRRAVTVTVTASHGHGHGGSRLRSPHAGLVTVTVTEGPGYGHGGSRLRSRRVTVGVGGSRLWSLPC